MCSRPWQVRRLGRGLDTWPRRKLSSRGVLVCAPPCWCRCRLFGPAAHACATTAALKLVASLAAEASAGQLRGAPLLDLLHARCAAAMGDAAAHRLAHRLLRAAAEPYFSMLERWLCEGAVDDPYAEFMVQADAVSLRGWWGWWWWGWCWCCWCRRQRGDSQPT